MAPGRLPEASRSAALDVPEHAWRDGRCHAAWRFRSEKAETEAKNTAIAKFKSNIEARFYTALAKQITDNVFGTDGLQQDSGTFTSPIGGEVVTWTTPSGTGNVVVTVTEDDGTVTTFTMPKEDNS